MYTDLEAIASRAKEHALMAIERGQAVEKLGKNIQKRHPNAADYGHEIEEYGLLIQYHAEKSLMYALLLQEQSLDSTDLFTEASQSRVQAVEARVKAIQLYSQAIQLYSQAIKLYGNCNYCSESLGNCRCLLR